MKINMNITIKLQLHIHIKRNKNKNKNEHEHKNKHTHTHENKFYTNYYKAQNVHQSFAAPFNDKPFIAILKNERSLYFGNDSPIAFIT